MKNSLRQSLDSRQQTADSRQQTADSRQQTAVICSFCNEYKNTKKQYLTG
jgi:hypothetical protein